MAYIIVYVALAAMLGSGTSFLAQAALPGQLLWGFKVHINEKIQALFQEEGKARTIFEIRAIEARLKEGALLDIRRSLDTTDIQLIEADIQQHADRIEQDIQKMLGEGRYREANTIATELQALLVKNVSGKIHTEHLLEKASQLSADTSALLQ